MLGSSFPRGNTWSAISSDTVPRNLIINFSCWTLRSKRLTKGSWFHIIRLPRVREALTNHCPICDKYMLQSGYIKGHIRNKHSHVAELLSHCEKRVRALSTSRPCVWCGKDFKRRDAHLRHCLVPCMCMLILHPSRPDTGEPSRHDVRHASSLLEPQLGESGPVAEPHRGDAALLRLRQSGATGSLSHGAGTGESVAEASPGGDYRRSPHQTSQAGVGCRKGEGTSQSTLSSWIRPSLPGASSAGSTNQQPRAPASTPGDICSLQTLPSARGCSQSPLPRHSPCPLLLQPRARPSLSAVESGQAMEDPQGGGQGQYVSTSHDGDVYPWPDQATSGLQEPESTWLTKNQWSYLLWDAQAKKHMFNADAEPMEHAQVIKNIDRLHRLLPQDNVLHRFHSLRPLTEASDAPVIAFIMDVGLRAEAAQEAYTLLRTVCQLSVTHGVDESPSGQASTVNLGQSHPSTARQAVGQMRLANSSNVCYMNAFLTAWMWSSWSIQHPALQVHAQARPGIDAMLEARRPFMFSATRYGRRSYVIGRIRICSMMWRSLPRL